MATGSPTTCAVLHAPGYVPGEHAGDIHLYEAHDSNGQWWLCDFDAEDGPRRTGIRLKRVDNPEAKA